MTVINGQIESLKRLKMILDKNGITRFNSIAQINLFLRDFDQEIESIDTDIELSLDKEINQLQGNLETLYIELANLKKEEETKLNKRISELTRKLNNYKEKSKKNRLSKIYYYFVISRCENKCGKLNDHFDDIITKNLGSFFKKIEKFERKINYIFSNRNKIIIDRSGPKKQKVEYVKNVVTEQYALIAGAIGENMVVKELELLSDDFYLINDFYLKFEPPIYNKHKNERIYSIQIDHLLLSRSGIFILETKNWSKKSIQDFNLRSPVEQISRASYALFTLLNSDASENHVELNDHHWGKKQIPIRNVIVMINNKPKEKFRFVKIQNINELRGYICYFEPIFETSEVERIYQFLIGLCGEQS